LRVLANSDSKMQRFESFSIGAGWCQALSDCSIDLVWDVQSQGPRFSSGSALGPSHDGIRRMRRTNLPTRPCRSQCRYRRQSRYQGQHELRTLAGTPQPEDQVIRVESPPEGRCCHPGPANLKCRGRDATADDFLPKLNSKTIRLVDNPRLVNQIAVLERRSSRGG
jgi:hypothetical protein